MSRTVCVSLSCLSVGVTLTGCATAPVQTAAGYASTGAHATYGAASTGAHAVYSTGGQVYMGVGQAAKKPFHDLNMMQDPIPVVLLRNESKPYDLAGVNSCERILNQVAELDMALGPDLDSPKDNGRNRVSRGADAAAVAALDAATDAAEHFLPMRSVIKRVSGATRYENHVKHAVLAGTERRSFLKAIGMAHNCGWPASPLIFNATDVAMASSSWAVPGASLQMVAIATPAPLAIPPLAAAPVGTQPSTMMVASAATPAAANPATVLHAPARGSVAAPAVETHTVALQTVALQPPMLKAAAPQTVASTPAAAPAFMQRVVKVSAAQTVDGGGSSAAASGYYPAPSTYVAPAATAAAFTSTGSSAPWATPQR